MIRKVAQNTFVPYDLIFKNFFDTSSDYVAVDQGLKFKHPVDVGVTDEALILQFACAGASMENIKIQRSRDTIRIKYSKQSDLDQGISWISRSISKSSFDLGYKISAKYDLLKSNARLENGLLTITIPVAEEEQFQDVEISEIKQK